MCGLTFDSLNCVYFSLFFVGVGYAIFIVITGGLSDLSMPDVDIDVPQVSLPGDVDIGGADIQISAPELPAAGLESPDVSVSPLSPITIATFVTVFGGVGVLCLQFFKVDPRWSLVYATGGAIVSSAIMFLFYSQVLIRSQASTMVHRGELVGLEAEVTVPIGKAAPGQVSYVTKAGRMSAVARSEDGEPIGRGQLVKIVRASGQQVVVRRGASAPAESDQW